MLSSPTHPFRTPTPRAQSLMCFWLNNSDKKLLTCLVSLINRNKCQSLVELRFSHHVADFGTRDIFDSSPEYSQFSDIINNFHRHCKSSSIGVNFLAEICPRFHSACFIRSYQRICSRGQLMSEVTSKCEVIGRASVAAMNSFFESAD